MTLVRTNIIANYLGQAWQALVAIAFVPMYADALGIEAFGLVGVMLSLQAMALLLDMGLGGVVNRELARRSALEGTQASMRSFVRTLEWVIWPVALVIALIISTMAYWMASEWLHPKELSVQQATHAIRMMGIAIALQWPAAFYTNALSGLERQPAANVVNAVFATLRSAGAVAVLLLVDRSVQAFMIWQAVVGTTHSLLTAGMVWRALPPGRARFVLQELVATKRFAAGLVGITALSIALTQLDRLLLSTLRPLQEVGYFTLAITVAAGLGRLIQPMFNAVYPRFSRLVAAGDATALRELYKSSTRYLCIVVASATAVLIAFPHATLLLWTGDTKAADIVAMPLAILVAGTFLNGLMNLPYAMQLAHGWTRLTIGTNLLALTISVPLGIYVIGTYGVDGAAYLWLVTNFVLLTVGLPLMHRRLLPGELAGWLRDTVLPPTLTAACVAALCAWITPSLQRNFQGLACLVLVSALTLLSASLSVTESRRRLFALMDRVPRHR